LQSEMTVEMYIDRHQLIFFFMEPCLYFIA